MGFVAGAIAEESRAKGLLASFSLTALPCKRNVRDGILDLEMLRARCGAFLAGAFGEGGQDTGASAAGRQHARARMHTVPR